MYTVSGNKPSIRAVIFFTALIFAITLLGGCRNENKEAPDNEITTDFLSDTVFAVGSFRVSLPEWYLYALPQMAADEALYGAQIWNYKVSDDRGTIKDVLKEDIFEQISYIKIVSAQAERLGISLNEDERGDIEANTIDYMNSLSSEQKGKYGITADIVRNVLSDNVLAMKVYENLTLNIDTDIPDEVVRHMVIEYICANKTRETDDDTVETLPPEELDRIRSDLDRLRDQAADDPGITRLSQLGNEEYSSMELVCDYDGLRTRFPEDIAEKVFHMRENEILGVFETDEAFFLFDCLKRNDEDATNTAKIAIIEQRQRELFDREYTMWKASTVVKINYSVWDNITYE